MIELLSVKTSSRECLIDITDRISEIVVDSGTHEGICLIFSQHTTCGITLNENADPDVRRDIIRELDKQIPIQDGYHHFEGNSAAHIKTTLVGSSAAVPISKGTLLLGTWQGIYLCEFDGPRNRHVTVQIISHAS
ncbi:MAG: secondary thiamine-phosphate synthase enzyme YjbQ [Spirochaetota bacterium]